MMQAADAGERSAMVYMANAFETGIGLGTERYGRGCSDRIHGRCFDKPYLINRFSYLLTMAVIFLILYLNHRGVLRDTISFHRF